MNELVFSRPKQHTKDVQVKSKCQIEPIHNHVSWVISYEPQRRGGHHDKAPKIVQNFSHLSKHCLLRHLGLNQIEFSWDRHQIEVLVADFRDCNLVELFFVFNLLIEIFQISGCVFFFLKFLLKHELLVNSLGLVDPSQILLSLFRKVLVNHQI